MTDVSPITEDTAEAPRAAPFGATDLASHVAAKLCHDFISPSGAIVSGLDLLKDPSAQDMREEAMSLIESSARKMVSIVHFARVAFGAATTSERFDAGELKTVLQGVFDHMRAELDWSVDVQVFEKHEARALLNLAYLGGGALPTGGQATVVARRDEDALRLAVESRGPRARLKPETFTGLKGEQLTDGLAGQWIQAYWLSQVVADAKGTLEVETDQDLVNIRIRLPA
jgi:histidine phosphotransferase ChpT